MTVPGKDPEVHRVRGKGREPRVEILQDPLGGSLVPLGHGDVHMQDQQQDPPVPPPRAEGEDQPYLQPQVQPAGQADTRDSLILQLQAQVQAVIVERDQARAKRE